MQISATKPTKRPAENVIAMINVVFLLLVFFLISARLTPPLPVEIEAPEAQGKEAELAPDTIVIGPDGTFYFEDLVGDEVLAALAGYAGSEPLTLRADKTLGAAVLARHLKAINKMTEAPVHMVVEN